MSNCCLVLRFVDAFDEKRVRFSARFGAVSIFTYWKKRGGRERGRAINN